VLEKRLTPAFNVTIGTTADFNVTIDDTVAGLRQITAVGTGAVIDIATIAAGLAAQGNVSISNGAGGAEPGNISWTAATTLTVSSAGAHQLTISADPSSAGGILDLEGHIADSAPAGGLNVSLSAKAGITIGAAGGMASGGGAISLNADNMTILGIIDAGPGVVRMRPFSAGRGVDLGSAGTAATLGLTDAELGRVTTSSYLEIGSALTTGVVRFMGPITTQHSGYTTLALSTAQTIENDTTLADFRGDGLALRAVGSIGPGLASNLVIQVAHLAASSDQGPSLDIDTIGQASIDSVAGLTGVVNNGGGISITSQGPLGVSANVNATGEVGLTAAKSAALQTSNIQTVANGIGGTNTSGLNSYAFGDVTQLQSGRLLTIFRHGAQEGFQNGTSSIEVWFSDDRGANWQFGATLYEASQYAANADVSTAAIWQDSAGRVFATFGIQQVATGYLFPRIMHTDDQGGLQGWSQPALLTDPKFTQTYTVEDRAVELPNGNLLLFGYGGFFEGKRSSSVIQSTDGGQNWTELAIVAEGQANGYESIEPDAIRLADGTLLCALRADSLGQIQYRTSSDNGATWSGVISSHGGHGKPSLVQLADGAIVCLTRSLDSTGESCLFISRDNGKSWSQEQDFDPTHYHYFYGGLVEIAPNVIGCAYGRGPFPGSITDWSYTVFSDTLTNNVTVTAGASVVSGAGNVALRASLGVVVPAGASLNAPAGTVTLTCGFMDNGIGGRVDLAGATTANALLVQGGAGNDTFNINPTTTSPVTVNGGDGADTFNITPNTSAAITVNGDDPASPNGADDSLLVDASATTDPFLSVSSLSGSLQGSYAFADRKTISFQEIATLAPATADLSITNSDDQSRAIPGTPIVYTIQVRNKGALGVEGVAISDAFPAILQNASWQAVFSTGSSGTTSGTGNLDQSINLAAGGTVTYTVSASVAASARGTLANTASLALPSGVADSDPSGSTATDSDALTPSADLVVAIGGPGTSIAGQAVTYTIAVRNAGPSDAESVTLAGVLATKAIFVSDSFPSGTRTDQGASVAYNFGAIAAGGAVSGNLVITLTKGGAFIFTTSAGSSANDPTLGNNTMSATTEVSYAPLNLTGQTISTTEGIPFLGTVATFTDANPFDAAADFTAGIDWSDGTSSPGTVVLNGSTFEVRANKIFTDEGMYSSKVRLQLGALEAAATGSAMVSEELLPDATRGTPDQRFISELFRDLLGRPVELSGLSFWSRVLQMGASHTAIVTGIQDTFEYRARLVNLLWQHYLHRPVESVTQQSEAQFLSSGGTVEQISIMVTSSPEYLITRAGGAGTVFLDALYGDVFQRAVDPGARAAFGPGTPRDQISLSVFTSAEYQSKMLDAVYLQFLDRPIDEGAKNFWEGKLQSGLTSEGLIAELASTAEFYNKTAE
jgi:uncharacterized repeat protein (TIGR01451 family)